MQTDRERQTGTMQTDRERQTGTMQTDSVRFTPEHVTLEAPPPSVSDHSQGVAVLADAQKGHMTHLTLPQGLITCLDDMTS
ncbi:hypothetical protein CRUP_025785 [Coryphaenoides rupestris]|nr:hypothetical protein CRUP_025785 [Coryphaenoides rupestris]